MIHFFSSYPHMSVVKKKVHRKKNCSGISKHKMLREKKQKTKLWFFIFLHFFFFLNYQYILCFGISRQFVFWNLGCTFFLKSRSTFFSTKSKYLLFCKLDAFFVPVISWNFFFCNLAVLFDLKSLCTFCFQISEHLLF